MTQIFMVFMVSCGNEAESHQRFETAFSGKASLPMGNDRLGTDRYGGQAYGIFRGTLGRDRRQRSGRRDP